jgi:hypothetical protein
VLTAFAVAVVFLALFVLVERRSRALIEFSLFANRIFTTSAVVTVIGMFAYLGTANATMPCIGAGDLTLSAIPATNLSIAAVAVPFPVVGIAALPRLGAALAAFNAAPAHAPTAQRKQLEAAVGAVDSRPLGANSVPATITLPNGHVQPFNPLKDVAFHVLSGAYSVGYLVCGLAALVATLIAAFVLGRRRHQSTFLETG